MPVLGLVIEEKWTPSRVCLATLTVIGVAVIFLAVFLFRETLLLLLLGIIIATALKPAIQWLQTRTHISRPAACTIVFVTLAMGMATAVVILAPRFIEQSSAMGELVSNGYGHLHEKMSQSHNRLLRRISEQMPATWRGTATDAEVSEATLGRVVTAFDKVHVVLKTLLSVIGVTVLAFYWALHEQRTFQSLLMMLPEDRRPLARELIDALQAKVAAFVLGQGILCGVMAVLCFLAYWIIGIPYALPLALLAGVLECLPVFGPILLAIPPILVALTVDPSKVVWVVLAAIAIQQFENYLLVPRVMDRSVGVTPLITMLALAGFTSIFGLLGAILAIPLAAIIQLLIERFIINPTLRESDTPPGRDAVSLLRYQTQELVNDVRQQVRLKEGVSSRSSDRMEEAIEGLACELDSRLADSTPVEARAEIEQGA